MTPKLMVISNGLGLSVQSNMATVQFGTCNQLNRKGVMQIYEQVSNLTEMCDRVLCFYSIRTPEPMVIGDGIPVSKSWSVVSTIVYCLFACIL